MREYKASNFEIIVKAAQGDEFSIQKIINHYSSLILYFSKEQGSIDFYNVEEIKLQLMKAILQFDIDK